MKIFVPGRGRGEIQLTLAQERLRKGRRVFEIVDEHPLPGKTELNHGMTGAVMLLFRLHFRLW